MLLLSGKNYKDRNIAGTNTFVGESITEKNIELTNFFLSSQQNFSSPYKKFCQLHI